MTTTPQQERPLLGAGILLLGIVSVALMDATAKIASDFASVWQITWARFFFHSLFMALPALWALQVWRAQTAGAARAAGGGRRLGVHVLRGLLLALSSAFFFVAIRDNPVPDSLAVFFVEPLLVMLFARIFLGERPGPRLIFAAFAGLAGVLIILRPGGSDYSWTIVFALAAAVSFAGYLVSARFASFHTPATITSWLTAAFGLLPTLPVFLFWESPPDLRAWGLLAAVGFLSGVGHTLIILACRYAAAAKIAVLHYAEVGVATLISWFLFAHWPQLWVWVGISLIAAANIYALLGERRH